jgi:hypothetical protein
MWGEMLKFFKVILCNTIIVSVVTCVVILSTTAAPAIHEIELLLAITQALLATGFLAIIATMESKR